MKNIFAWMLYDVMGWKKNITVEHPDKYIICLAPHTSNWDFIIGNFYSWGDGINTNYMMKKEWFFWPLGPLFRKTGGIPVDRKKNTSLTEVMAEEARKAKSFRLCITPEGTRKPTRKWKRGFYYISMKANIPILLYALDYENRIIHCTRMFIPTGDIDKDMREIKEYYRGIKGKKPENFLI